MDSNLSREQRSFFELAQRDGYLTLHQYDLELTGDLELEWRTWCERNRLPFVKLELCEQGATLEYSLRRFPVMTDLTEAEIDELEGYAINARGSELSQCFPNWGRIGFIAIRDARQLVKKVQHFCLAGVRHWLGGASVARFEPAQRRETA